MNKTILIVGAGQLGRRHLQSLANLEEAANIFVVDQSEQALEAANASWLEMQMKADHEVSFHKQFDFESNAIDLAIIATGSLVRSGVTQQLIAKFTLKNIIFEKFLFPTLAEYDVIDKLLAKNNIKAWVNCPRRMYDVYKSIKQIIKGPIHLSVSGTDWGLACNSVHFLDLFAMLAGHMPTDIKSVITSDVMDSKRHGYIEFTGVLTGYAETGDSFSISSLSGGNQPVCIYITDQEHTWLIQESKRSLLTISQNDEVVSAFDTPYQSQLTALAANMILKNGNCDLPLYNESEILHKLILSVFLADYNRLTNNINNKLCPIT